MKQVVVRVPATSANLGPGFDVLGLALGLYNRLIERAGVANYLPVYETVEEAMLRASC